MRSRIAIAALCCALLAAAVGPSRARAAAGPRDPIADDATGGARVVAAGHTTPRLLGREPSSPTPAWGKLPPYAPMPAVVWMHLASGEAAGRTPAHAPVAPPAAPRSCRGPPAA
jgi:hypothetical protein